MKHRESNTALRVIANPWNMLLILAILFMMAGKADVYAETLPLGVTEHSQEEIRTYIRNNGVDIYTPTNYITSPELPNTVGEMDDQSKENALKMLNNIRYIAGVSPVVLDDDMGQMAQAAAFVCNSIGTITHYPAKEYTKPSGMDQAIWDLGVEGCASSNLAYKSAKPPMTDAVLYWMSDEDNSNISRVGHRRWCINPYMGKTGFGISNGYYAMYSIDTAGNNGHSGAIAWPAQNTPFEYFKANQPWTISLGKIVSDVDVRLVRDRDQKEWNFTSPSETPVSGQDYFYIHNPGSGYIARMESCVIFRPYGLDIRAGDTFHVTVSGDVDMNYDVHFFPLVPASSVSIDDSLILSVGGAKRLSASVLPEDASDKACVWRSENPAIATVSDNGTVTGISRGKTRIIASAGDAAAYCDVTVGIDSFSLPESKTVAKGKTLSLKSLLTYEPEEAVIADPVWTSENEAIASVSNKGIVTGVGTGETVITAVLEGKRASCRIRVGKDIGTGTFSCKRREYTYTGYPIKPDVEVSYNGTVLTEGKDYEIECLRNTDVNYSGEPTIYLGEVSTFKIVGTGDFGGELGSYYSRETYFYISALSLSSRSISDQVEVQKYNGSRLAPEPVLIFNGEPLVEYRDYTIYTYNDNINAGTGKITLIGMGNFSGKRTVEFTIDPADISEAEIGQPEDCIYKGEEHKPEITVEYDGNKLVEDRDYQVSFLNNTNAGTARVTVEGKGNYTGNKEVTFTIHPAELTRDMLSPIDDQVYGGADLRPELVLKDETGRLRADGDLPDYEAVYTDNRNVGTANVTINGKNNYTGSLTGSFEILPKDLHVKAKDASKTIGESDPKEFVLETDNGLIQGHFLESGPVSREEGEEVGTYVISFDPDLVKVMEGSGEDASDVTSNYNISCENGTFTIKEKVVEPDDNPPSGGENPSDPSGGDGGNPSNPSGSGTTGSQPAPAGPAKKNYDPVVGDSPLFNKSAAQLTNTITKSKSEEGPKGTVFGLMQLRASGVSKSGIKITWKAVKGAAKYVVFASPCGSRYRYRKQITTKKRVLTFKKISKKAVKKGTYYKFMVLAVDKNGKSIGVSKTIHVATKGGKVCNPKKLTITAPKKTTVTLKKGKTCKIKVKQTKESAKLKLKVHRKPAFESSNPKIASVSAAGIVKARARGSAKIYIYSQNGICKAVAIKVK